MENDTNREAEETAAQLQSVALADGAVLAADPEQRATPEEMASNIIGSAVFLALGIFLTVCAFRMPNSALTGDPKKWYISPGVFPGFIGIGLTLMSFAMICKSLLQCRKAGHKLSSGHFKPRVGGTDTVRLLWAGALLTLYISSLGTINFTMGAFLFLSATMFSFKTKEYPLVKILVFSAVIALGITYGFGTLARIPLP